MTCAIEIRGVTKTYGATTAVDSLDLTIPAGSFTVLLGPSGCGKSTLLRILAGLETSSQGEVWFGGRRVDPLPPARRDIAMVFQDFALYGHMTVAENVEFPLRVQRIGRAERRRRAAAVLELLELGPLAGRRPAQLSGGQRQRVAMGRALVRRPQVFLMDEPLSNLDARLRAQVRAEIVSLHRHVGTTTVYVTHDQVEAMTMGHEVAVLRDGRLEQHGPPQDVYADPDTSFVASFLGAPPAALLPARREPAAADASTGGLLRSGRLTLGPSVLATAAAADIVTVGIRPEHVQVEHAAPRSRAHGSVTLVERLGAETLVHVDVDEADATRPPTASAPDTVRGQVVPLQRTGRAIVARVAGAWPGAVGDRVLVKADPTHLLLFDRDGRRMRTGDPASHRGQMLPA